MRRDESGAVGDEEVVFDQDTFANKLRQNCISSSNPWCWYVQLRKDMRMKSREAPSTDLEETGWKAKFSLIVLWKDKEQMML